MNKLSGIIKELYQSPIKLVLTFIFIIPFIDLLLALLLRVLPPLPAILVAFIDSTLLVIVLAPIVYYLVFHPVLKDIAERKHAEEVLKEREARLRELNATKDKFFSIIAHDLKNPFNTILGFSNLLSEQLKEKDYEKIEEYAVHIQSSSKRVMDLLLNLLEWSLSQTGLIEFNPGNIEIDTIINDVIELSENSAKQKSIAIKSEVPDSILVFADKAMISLILRNLVSNAIKFTNPGGMIIVSAELRIGELIISVSDNGIGIDKNTIEKLFLIEENNSTTGTQNETGTGLGLILCKEFVEKHGGRIWVESEPGKGSAFRFTLPGVEKEKGEL
jgi:signal transduction histidine kinase